MPSSAVVCALGWNLLHYEPRVDDTPVDPEQARLVALGRAFYPLTLPVSVDAGVIAVAITLGAHHAQSLEGKLGQLIAAVLGSAVIAASLLLVYRYATRVSGWIGSKGMEEQGKADETAGAVQAAYGDVKNNKQKKGHQPQL